MLLLLITMLLAMAPGAAARANTPPLPGLAISVDKGDAPLRVTITGPADLTGMIDACKYRTGWITPYFLIDWGDGIIEPDYRDKNRQGHSCAHVRTHEYTAPGTYKITVRRGHLGPTDAPVTDWQGEAIVTVTGKASTPTRVELLEPVPGQTFRYQEPGHVRWKLATATPVDITATLTARDGSMVASGKTDKVAYNGEGRTPLPLPGNQAYEAALNSKAGPYTLTLIAQADGVIVAQDSAGNINLTSLLPGGIRNGTANPASGRAPLKVVLNYNYFHEACLSYEIDWGDATGHTKKVRPLRDSCTLKSGTLQLEHMYWKAGDYKIRIRSNNLDPLRPFNKISAYEEVLVTVK